MILFLKEGNNDTYGIIYYIAGEIQGKFQIKDGKVFSVNDSMINKPYYEDGTNNPDEFKEKIIEAVNKK